jgi:hypothetical protein
MMRMLATYIMRGRIQAILVAAAFAAITPVIPPLVLLSGATVALVTLRLGAKDGVLTGIGAMVIAMAFFMVVAGNPAPALNFALVLYIPLFVLAIILRNSMSLARTLSVLAVLGTAMVPRPGGQNLCRRIFCRPCSSLACRWIRQRRNAGYRSCHGLAR